MLDTFFSMAEAAAGDGATWLEVCWPQGATALIRSVAVLRSSAVARSDEDTAEAGALAPSISRADAHVGGRCPPCSGGQLSEVLCGAFCPTPTGAGFAVIPASSSFVAQLVSSERRDVALEQDEVLTASDGPEHPD
mmetsp:Transcript_5185/g.11127  ORF Transcript_5185/g.11127 Transcript_5185/m.11127 type:complete len:136 (+) Transcript_5185:442-849(+)